MAASRIKGITIERLANLYDPSDGFTIYIPDDDKEKEKRALAGDIHFLVDSKYTDIMRKAGIDVKWSDDIYWGCERKLCPEKYGTDDNLVSFAEYESIVKSCYEEAFYCAVQRVFELNFEIHSLRVCSLTLGKKREYFQLS